MRPTRRPTTAALLAAGLLVSSACAAAPGGGSGDLAVGNGVTDDTITVLSLTDLSGPAASGGRPAQAGLEAYVEHLNANGGIDGRDVELITEDHQYNPQLAVQQYRSHSNDIAALVTYGTPTTDAIRPFTADDEVLSLGFKGPYQETNTFAQGTAFEVDTANLLTYALEENPGAKVGVIYQADAMGDAILRGVEAVEEATGTEIVAEASADATANDLTAQVTAMRRAGADTVVLGVGPGGTIAAVGAASSLGYDAQLLSPGTAYNRALLDLPVGPAMEENMIVSCSYPLWDSESEGNTTFHEALGDDVEPQGTIVLGWIAGMMIEDFIRDAIDAGDATPAGIVAAAQGATVSTDGLTPDMTFGEDINDRTPFRASQLCSVNADEDDGVTQLADWFESEAASAVELQ
ncbi:ABC transporter substrate-binding protein [Nocardioides zeae]|uniref:ABC transporter substrate-binding protein n=1 Tax=Nocardioides imazamoxiresistens TaxID=3231893 RepID=A0ABU3PR32_9ACTN|nr:ABC transporter substrate-binding protein [Nocardioides zeae]MDT9591641.1 ABC transporter substrate-binding protein [Nocardioides zeae]